VRHRGLCMTSLRARMDTLQRALLEHSERLEAVRGKAERLDEAIAGGQGLHKVVATSRILRQELAEIHMLFQVANSSAKIASLLLLLSSALRCW
jgi:hypothetical protein